MNPIQQKIREREGGGGRGGEKEEEEKVGRGKAERAVKQKGREGKHKF